MAFRLLTAMAIPILSVILTVALLATATACTVYDGVWLPFAAGLAIAFVASGESWSRKSEQDDKWSFCLTAGTLCPANQERQ
jgi:hypothetical protein